MFGWFKRKSNDKPVVETVAKAAPPPAVETVAETAKVVVEAVASSLAPAIAPAASSAATTVAAPRQIGLSSAERVRVLHKPILASKAVEILQNKRKRPAEIVRIQAGGRRVVARLGESGRTYAYTRRPDGTFRLECAPTATATRLVTTLH